MAPLPPPSATCNPLSQKPKVWPAVRTPKAKSLRESEKATPVGFHREGKARQPILHAKDATDLQILTKLGQVGRLCLGTAKLGRRSSLTSFFAELLGIVEIVMWRLDEERYRGIRVTRYPRCQDTPPNHLPSLSLFQILAIQE